MKRIFLFLATNIAVLVVVSIVLRLLGIDQAMAAQGGMGPLLAFSAVVGFTGAIISLLMSKFIVKMSTRAQVVTGSEGETQAWLVKLRRIRCKVPLPAGRWLPEKCGRPMRPGLWTESTII